MCTRSYLNHTPPAKCRVFWESLTCRLCSIVLVEIPKCSRLTNEGGHNHLIFMTALWPYSTSPNLTKTRQNVFFSFYSPLKILQCILSVLKIYCECIAFFQNSTPTFMDRKHTSEKCTFLHFFPTWV